MGSEWKVTTLSQVTTRIGDGLHGTPEYSETGDYFFVNGNNLKNGKIVFDEKTKKVSEDQYLKHRKDIGDRTLLLSINGTLGNVAEFKGEPIILGKSACYLNVSETTDKEFIKFVLTSKNFQDYLHNLSTGSTIKNASLALVRNYEFLIPNLDTQNSISSILGALDKKITTIEAINQTLGAMAQAIFKSWFVDFDPVKAKAQIIAQGGIEKDANLAAMEVISGKTRDQLAALEKTHPEHYTQLHTTATLFPSAFEDSELGEIPEGWEVTNVSSILTLNYGRALKSTDRITGDVPVYGSGGVNGYHNESLVTEESIVVGRKGSIGNLFWVDKPFFPIDTTFYVSTKHVPLSFCYYTLMELNLPNMNTDAAVPGLNRENVYRCELCLPPLEILLSFDTIQSSLKQLISSNRREISHLENIRDSLLPKLLSGELEI